MVKKKKGEKQEKMVLFFIFPPRFYLAQPLYSLILKIIQRMSTT